MWHLQTCALTNSMQLPSNSLLLSDEASKSSAD
uniref:Uncharacterized protein n=1 Tax=Arundo donax TaxID=35708 RepID=A0A0A9FQ05_ARUDO